MAEGLKFRLFWFYVVSIIFASDVYGYDKHRCQEDKGANP